MGTTLRRLSFKAHNGLILDYRIEDLVKRSIGYVDLPQAARGAATHSRPVIGLMVGASLHLGTLICDNVRIFIYFQYV